MIRRLTVSTDCSQLDAQPPAGALSRIRDVEIRHEGGRRFNIETLDLKPGIKIVIANHANHGGFRMRYEIEQAPVSLCFSLSRGYRCTVTRGEQKGEVLERRPGERVLTYLPGSAGIVEIPAGSQVRGVSIHFSMEMFRALFREDMPSFFSTSASPPRSLYLKSGMNRETAFAVGQIMDCPYQGRLRQVFLEAKAMELGVCSLAGPVNPLELSDFRSGDLERIREAHGILSSCLDNPPGLSELGRRVGLNRNKLNQGFSQVYGGTVFKVLRDLRLARAWILLLNTELSLVDIAFSVGYNNQSNFTAAFHRHWGRTPGIVRLNRISPEFSIPFS